MRRNSIGFVYQAHHLLPEFSAVENVAPQMVAAGVAGRTSARSAVLPHGLAERLTHRPAALSGGEQQRVAIARAVANVPRLLLADEPTGNLDPKTSDHVFHALIQLIRASGLTVMLATHNMEIAARMDRRVTIRDGQIVELS
jgi:lipoprotein-releasing system ATP-binding protein